MPCYDPRDGYDKAHNNVAADLLCSIMKKLPPQAVEVLKIPGLAAWWNDHQNRDQMYSRMAKEPR